MAPLAQRRVMLAALAALAVALVLGAWWLLRRESAGAGVARPAAAAPSLVSSASSHAALEPPDAPELAAEAAAPRRSTSDGPRRVRGTVIDATTGKPIAAATFHGASASATTDRDGAFTCLEKEPPPFPFVVEAEGYAFLAGELDETTASAARDEALVFPLVASTPIHGRAVDMDGRALRYVRLELVRADGTHGAPSAPAPPGAPAAWRQVPEAYGVPTVSDDEGRFKLLGAVALSRSSALRAVKRGFDDALVTLAAPRPGAPLELVVVLRRIPRPGFGELAGTVELGREGVRADLHWRTAQDDGYGASEDDGFFRLELPAGPVTISAILDRDADGGTELACEADAAVRDGERTWVELPLVPRPVASPPAGD